MSVTTTADKKIEEAKEQLSLAYKNLLGVLDEDCYGHNAFTNDYIDVVQEVVSEILKQKRRL